MIMIMIIKIIIKRNKIINIYVIKIGIFNNKKNINY